MTATAELVHTGRTTIVVQTDLRDDDGHLVARTLQTQAVLRRVAARPPPPERRAALHSPPRWRTTTTTTTTSIRREHVEDVELDDEAARAAAELEVRRRLALAQIRQYGDPVLRMRAPEVTEFDDELRRVTERMIALMHEAAGVGLAATQVGVLRRVFVFHDDGEDHVLVNPVITKSGKAVEVDEEGCLSLGPVRVDVERPVEVTIEGRDASGEPVSYLARGPCRAGRPARARPSRRDADHRPHRPGIAARGAPRPPAEARALEVSLM